jgi:hypothetical protein
LTNLRPILLRGGALLATLAFGACAKDGAEKEAPAKRDRIVDLTEESDGRVLGERYGFKKDDIARDESGTFVGGKRSQYDGQRNIAFGGGVGTAKYRTNEYKSSAWSGNTKARTSSYANNTDASRYQVSSRYEGSRAHQNAARSRFDGTQARTSSYKTGKANENAGERLAKPSDSLTDVRRRVYPQPDIMSKEDYDRLTVEQTRSILGRDR